MNKKLIVTIFAVLALLVAACAAPGAARAPEADEPAAETSDSGEAVAPSADTETGANEEAPYSEEANAAESQDLATVRMGIIPITIFAPVFVADAKGYFAEEGIKLEILAQEGGPENVVQVAAGNFDAAGSGIGAGMLNAIERGIEFEIVAPLHTERPPLTSPFVVSKERYDSGELTSMADMDGKKVSINSKGAATEYWLWNALQQGGLDFPDVEVVGVAYRDTTPALQNGSLDGGILSEPLATLMEDQGLVTRLSQDFIDHFTPTYVFFNKDWAAANPDLAKGFVKAYLRGARDLNGDQWYTEENASIIEQYTGVPTDVILRANRSYHDPNGEIPIEDIETLEDFFRAQGELAYDEDLDLSPYVNSSYAEAAVQELGGPVEWK